MLSACSREPVSEPCAVNLISPELDCTRVVAAWNRAVEHFATVDVRARTLSPGDVRVFRPAGVAVSGGAPRFCCGPGMRPVQGLFYEPDTIHVAYEEVVYCEALHYIALKLGDPNWQVTGHDVEGDVLHFPCWSVIQDEYSAR